MDTPSESSMSTAVLGDVAAALASGRPIAVESAARGGHLVLAASLASGQQLGRLVRHTSGFLLAAMTDDRLDALAIPAMTGRRGPTGERYAVSVDASAGITTGISGYDRATTLRLLASPHAGPDDLVRPCHVVPVRTDEYGVLARSEASEAAVDLMRLADLPSVAAVAAIVDQQGELLNSAQTQSFAGEHALAHVAVAELLTHRLHTEPVPASRSCPAVQTTQQLRGPSLPGLPNRCRRGPRRPIPSDDVTHA